MSQYSSKNTESTVQATNAAPYNTIHAVIKLLAPISRKRKPLSFKNN